MWLVFTTWIKFLLALCADSAGYDLVSFTDLNQQVRRIYKVGNSIQGTLVTVGDGSGVSVPLGFLQWPGHAAACQHVL